MEQAEKIMNKEVLNESILETWKLEASKRKTIAFCTTVRDAEALSETFVKGGVKSAVLHGKLKKAEREPSNRLSVGTMELCMCVCSVSFLFIVDYVLC